MCLPCCMNAGCKQACPAPLACCVCTCTDLQTDPRNCGGCGVDCETTASSNICVAGVCQAGQFRLAAGDATVTFDTAKARTIIMPATPGCGSSGAADVVSFFVDTSAVPPGDSVCVDLKFKANSGYSFSLFVDDVFDNQCQQSTGPFQYSLRSFAFPAKTQEFRVRGWPAGQTVTGTATMTACVFPG